MNGLGRVLPLSLLTVKNFFFFCPLAERGGGTLHSSFMWLGCTNRARANRNVSAPVLLIKKKLIENMHGSVLLTTLVQVATVRRKEGVEG